MSAADTVFAVFGNLHTAGYPIDLSLVNGIDSTGCDIPKSLPDLPEYPFNHDTSYWHESKISKDHRLHPFGRNDLLGVSDPNCNPFEMRWRNFVRVSEMPWTKDHQVRGDSIWVVQNLQTNNREGQWHDYIPRRWHVGDGYRGGQAGGRARKNNYRI